MLLGLCVAWLGVALIVMSITRDHWYHTVTSDVLLTGIVVEEVDARGVRQTVRIRSDAFPRRVQVTMTGTPRVREGDMVEIGCELTNVEDVSWKQFRYDRYLMKENVSVLCDSWRSPHVLGRARGVRVWLSDLRLAIEKNLTRYLHEPHASLLTGILYGSVSMLPDGWRDAFRRSGMSHIVAVSGYNVMLVASAAMRVLTYWFLKRQYAYVVVMICVAVFAALAGGGAAVVRAAIMGGLVLSAQQIGRPSSSLMLLLLAATGMTIARPRILLDDAGFHLSFAAAAGLMWLSPQLSAHLPFLPTVIRKTAADSLSAIAATAPILLWQFHQWSSAALIANILIVPLIPLAMVLGVVAILGSWVAAVMHADIAGFVMTFPSYIVLDLILSLVQLFASLPFFDWT